MQLISADHYAYFLDAVTEMHSLRYRVFKERFDWDGFFRRLKWSVRNCDERSAAPTTHIPIV